MRTGQGKEGWWAVRTGQGKVGWRAVRTGQGKVGWRAVRTGQVKVGWRAVRTGQRKVGSEDWSGKGGMDSGVARGGLRGLEHPLSQKRKKNRIGIFQKIKIYLSVILNTKISTYIRISV